MTSVFDELMTLRGGEPPQSDEVTIDGADPVLSTRFRIGETCASVIGGVAVAVNDIWELKRGRRQRARVDVRHAAAALRSTHYLQTRDGTGRFQVLESPSMRHMATITQPWPTRDGRWFLPHFNLPHLQQRVCGVLQCEPTPDAVGGAVARWNALDLEAAIDEARACGAMVRSHAQWQAHPHGQALAARAVVSVDRIGDSPPEPFPSHGAPLADIRALDLTRILAGPIAARTLAEHGADVLMVGAAHLPQVKEHVVDTSHGKRSCLLDLRARADRDTLMRLVSDADVFSQGYRPGIMERHGLSPQQLANVRPGIVYVSVTCFGPVGPFRHRPGWEQVAQTVSGICHDGAADRPALLPAAACDYVTGYLGAYGALLALARRAREGGSYHVQVSLCQSAMLIYRQGKTGAVTPGMDLSSDELAELLIESDTAQGTIRHLRPVLELSETRPHWRRPTPVLGGDPPRWLSADEPAAA